MTWSSKSTEGDTRRTSPPRVGMNLTAPSWQPTETTADPAFQSRQVRSKVVLSFAMKGGGDMFVRWLHNKLMERCALSKKSVYADHILAPYLALEDVPFAEREVVGPLQRAIEADLYPGLPSGIYGQTIKSLPVRKPKKSEVPDLRAAMMRPDGSFPPSGIRREDWEVLFQSAVRSSQVAVLVLNDQYTNSDYCKAEVRMIRDENELRVQEDRSPLRVVALRVNKGVSNDATNMNVIDQMIRSAMDNPTVLSVTPEMPSADTPNARQINWTISDGDLDRIVQAIGNLSAT